MRVKKAYFFMPLERIATFHGSARPTAPCLRGRPLVPACPDYGSFYNKRKIRSRDLTQDWSGVNYSLKVFSSKIATPTSILPFRSTLSSFIKGRQSRPGSFQRKLIFKVDEVDRIKGEEVNKLPLPWRERDGVRGNNYFHIRWCHVSGRT